MRQLNKLLVTFALSITFLGCASTDPEEEIQNSGFLSDYSQLQFVDKDDNSITRTYTSEKVAVASYKKVIIEPVVYFPALASDDQISKEVQHEIRAYIEKGFVDTLGEKYQIVDQAGADTFTLRVGITGLTIDDKELAVYQYIPISFLITAASGGLSEMTVKLQLETEGLDSQTKELLFASTKLDAGETLDDEETQLTFKHLEPLLSNWFKTLDASVNK